MKTDLSKVSALEYADKLKAIMKSLGGSGEGCSGIPCDDCLFFDKNTGECISNFPTVETIQSIMDYEIPTDWHEVQRRVDAGEDIKVLVSVDGKAWKRRYFAKYEDGIVYAYDSGLTKWSNDGNFMPTYWKYAKLAE